MFGSKEKETQRERKSSEYLGEDRGRKRVGGESFKLDVGFKDS